jgi:hypothetical protein
MKLPRTVKIRQNFKTRTIKDIPGVIHSKLGNFEAWKIISPGQSVAVTAGSRGIVDIADILAALVRALKGIGAKPFIVPAMGSHGGATVQGQVALLAHYGMTEEFMGVPIKSSMDVIQVGTTGDGIPVLVDKVASGADHIVVVNRVKPHTDFEGKIGSGLMKMMSIGLGKQAAADIYHNEFMRLGHHRVITSTARIILEKCPIAFGLAIVENQKDETEILEFIAPEHIEETEHKLLVRAKEILPRIPFDPIDILIVDEIGKNFSGTGMDQNVIARTVIPYHKVPTRPVISRILVRDLSPDSGGNALGIGNADFTTRRLVDKIDRETSYMNSITSSCPEITRIPPYYESDSEMLEAAFRTIPGVDHGNVRMVHIRNTLKLEEMEISEALMTEAEKSVDIDIMGTLAEIVFDTEGNLVWHNGCYGEPGLTII